MVWANLPFRLGTLILAAVFVLYSRPLAAEYIPKDTSVERIYPLSFKWATPQLWSYLRSGLNYLESPHPLLSPESTPPGYIHPDSKGFGAYGFSPAAFEDVQRIYPFFRQYRWQDIMSSPKLYDLANQAFADLLLKNLANYLPEKASNEQVFSIIHQAWNLGLTGFKNGRQVVASRTKRALEFTANSRRGKIL
jgi:hypothetical protein